MVNPWGGHTASGMSYKTVASVRTARVVDQALVERLLLNVRVDPGWLYLGIELLG